VFCGGTGLSKAHGLIERMSEDVDLKVVLDPGHSLSNTKLRQHLGDLRQVVIETMGTLGFEIIEAERVSRNENRYFATGWNYAAQYQTHSSLRPHLSLEFTVRTPRFTTEQKSIGYLVDRLAERQGASIDMACIAVEETLAEKVLSFLGRHAERRAGVMEREWDRALVRHIYNTYSIVSADATMVDRAETHFRDLVANDVVEFTRHAAFTENPKACLGGALEAAGNEEQTRTEYESQWLLPVRVR
jgi:predicted nucleotidyltransferase component of viral defense system